MDDCAARFRKNQKKSTKRFKNISEYIKSCPKDVGAKLQTIRMIVRKAAPNAQEVISYNMPAFKLNGLLLYFVAHTNHIGLYPYSSVIRALKNFELRNSSPLHFSTHQKHPQFSVIQGKSEFFFKQLS